MDKKNQKKKNKQTENKVKELITKAVDRAKANKRRTVMGKDV